MGINIYDKCQRRSHALSFVPVYPYADGDLFILKTSANKLFIYISQKKSMEISQAQTMFDSLTAPLVLSYPGLISLKKLTYFLKGFGGHKT